MKKILSLILIVCMICGIFCGCGKNANSDETVLTDEKQIQQTITDYVNAVYAFDFEKALDVVKKDTNLYVSIEQMSATYSIDALIDAMFVQLSIPEEYKEKIKTIMQDWIVKTMSDSVIETTNIVIDGDTATADVKISTPDLTRFGYILENYENYISEEQLDQLLQKYSLSFGEDTQWKLIIDVLPIVFDTATKDIEYIDSETKVTLQKIEDKWLVSADEQ